MITKDTQLPLCDAFKNLKPSAGLLIWRIEKFIPVPVPRQEYGRFHTGDSYLILSTVEPPRGPRRYEAHFWLGAKSSQDERGAAAYRTVELCQALPDGAHAPHHRECQGAESVLFMSYFPGGVEYLEGGVATGFRSAEEAKKQRHRLLQVKGKRVIRVKEVPLNADSLNCGDVFVLDADDVIYQWQGKESSRLERAKAVEMCIKIRDDLHCSRARIEVIPQGEETEAFWDELGGKKPIKSAAEGGSDTEQTAQTKKEVKLYWLSDKSGSLEVKEITQRPLVKDLLKSEDAYILDTGAEIFAWVGKNASQAERFSAMAKAEKFLDTKKRPLTTPITRICDGGETPLFKSYFHLWPEANMILKLYNKEVKGTAAKAGSESIDVAAMHAAAAAEDVGIAKVKIPPPDKITFWRIEGHDKVAVEGDATKVLASQECYVVLTQWKDDAIVPIVYYWLGSQSKVMGKGTAALTAIEIDKSQFGQAVQVRVVQGKEPDSFLDLFKEGLVVVNEKKFDASKPHLLQVRGTTLHNVHSVEVEAKATSLNSNDAFILLAGGKSYLWKGKGASDVEAAVAVSAGKIVAAGNTVVEVAEGSEPEEFWKALGGKASYANQPWLFLEYRDPRLFHCSDVTGGFRVEEIEAFSQEDLVDSDVMILDCFQSVFVWIGSKANADEKRNAMEVAQKYVAQATDGRGSDTPIYLVEAGREPLIFTSQFHAWDNRLQKVQGDACDKAMAKLVLIDESLAKLQRSQYPLEVLQKRPLPEGVEASKLVEYLSDADFEKAFKMDRNAFYKLARWKRDELRQKAKLF